MSVNLQVAISPDSHCQIISIIRPTDLLRASLLMSINTLGQLCGVVIDCLWHGFCNSRLWSAHWRAVVSLVGHWSVL